MDHGQGTGTASCSLLPCGLHAAGLTQPTMLTQRQGGLQPIIQNGLACAFEFWRGSQMVGSPTRDDCYPSYMGTDTQPASASPLYCPCGRPNSCRKMENDQIQREISVSRKGFE